MLVVTDGVPSYLYARILAIFMSKFSIKIAIHNFVMRVQNNSRARKSIADSIEIDYFEKQGRCAEAPRDRSFHKEKLVMASNKTLVPEAKQALEQFKMQAANEVGVTLNQNGYNGQLTSAQAGSIGGQMVKKMVESYENSLKTK